MKQNYIPHAFRSLAPKKTVKLPQRRVLNHDEEMLEYHRETLLLFADMAINTAEKILDSDIVLAERVAVQKVQDELYKLNEAVKDRMKERTIELHESRVDFLEEMMSLCTLVKPKHFDMTQKWMVQKVKDLHRLKD